MSALGSKGSTSAWRKLRQRILQRDGFSCQQCGAEGNTVDHIVPRAAGGGDEDYNLQCLCTNCNLRKGGRFFFNAPTLLTLPCPLPPQKGSTGSKKPLQGSVSHDHD